MCSNRRLHIYSNLNCAIMLKRRTFDSQHIRAGQLSITVIAMARTIVFGVVVGIALCASAANAQYIPGTEIDTRNGVTTGVYEHSQRDTGTQVADARKDIKVAKRNKKAKRKSMRS